MTLGYRLVPLDCESCGAPLAAGGEDVVYYCTACRNGYRLDPERDELSAVEVSFVSAASVSADHYLPFWLLPATVGVERREAARSLRRSRGFFSQLAAGGSDRATFAIPAFDLPLERALALATRYTLSFPQLGERLGEKLEGGIYSPRDAEKLAHFTLIAAEADEPDTLRELSYRLDFDPPRLLGVPFRRDGERRFDALFGLPA